MATNKVSVTALATSLMRALHSQKDPYPIINDPWGYTLVPKNIQERFQQKALATIPPEAISNDIEVPAVDIFLRRNPAYATVVSRTRYTEDALHQAFANGTRQYVLLGAGFDSYFLRVPKWVEGLAVYEIDHPDTQNLKRQCIEACDATLGGQTHFLAADLATECLGEILLKSSYQRAEPAFFSWLGVSMYLSREANLAALRALAEIAVSGSEIVFSYIDQAAFSEDSSPLAASMIYLRQAVAALGEPLVSGFDPASLNKDLYGVGFELIEDMDDFQMARRYDPENRNAFRPDRLHRIAHARVLAKA